MVLEFRPSNSVFVLEKQIDFVDFEDRTLQKDTSSLHVRKSH